MDWRSTERREAVISDLCIEKKVTDMVDSWEDASNKGIHQIHKQSLPTEFNCICEEEVTACDRDLE